MPTINPTSQSGVYAIRCTANAKVYIGSAIKFSKRWNEHRRHLKKGIHPSPSLQRAWTKYGADEFVFEVLEFAQPADLVQAEQRWLDKVQPFSKKGFNTLTVAYSVLGFKHTADSRAKMSASHKELEFTPEHRANLLAAARTPERRAELSALQKGRKDSPDTRAKKTARARNRSPQHQANLDAVHRTPEARERSRAFHTGRKRPAKTCAKISQALMGRTVATDTRAKLSAIRTGSKHTLATRAKLSALANTPEALARSSVTHKGSKRTVDTRAKMSAAWTPDRRAERSAVQIGHDPSPEARANMAAAQQRRRAREKEGRKVQDEFSFPED